MKYQKKITIFDVADYFLEETEFKMTHMKLHKLIYYAHVRHLLKHKELLTDAEIQAWAHGPVFPELYPIFEDFTFEAIKQKTKKGDFTKIKGKVKNSIDYIIEKYGHWDGQRLTNKTHFEQPWREAIDKGLNFSISDEAMKKYYVRKNKI